MPRNQHELKVNRMSELSKTNTISYHLQEATTKTIDKWQELLEWAGNYYLSGQLSIF